MAGSVYLCKIGNADYDKNGDCLLACTSCILDIAPAGTTSLSLSCRTEGVEGLACGAVVGIEYPEAAVKRGFDQRQLFVIDAIDRFEDSASITAYPIGQYYASVGAFCNDLRPGMRTLYTAMKYLADRVMDDGNGNRLIINEDFANVGTAFKQTSYYIRKSLMDCFVADENALFEIFGVDIGFLWNNWEVRPAVSSGYGMQAVDGLNIESLKESVSMEGVLTKVLPVGFNGREGELQAAPVEPLIYGREYVGTIRYDNIALEEDLSEEQLEDGTFTICRSQAELNAALKEAVEKDFAAGLHLPRITYDISMVDLSSVKDYAQFNNLMDLWAGDVIEVHHHTMNIDTIQTVSALTYDVLNEKIMSITLGTLPDSWRCLFK